MKNFRKVLALVLVVATLFSFVAMTASAKEYTDTDKVSYTEAVDVLTAIGILNGYTDGTYRPTNTIARAEMAKMIAVLANAGKDNIGDLYASACKFADMTGDAVWAKSYVAYCNQIGIVAGRNATTFDPYGKVTGVETAKMLLCMIGFDAKAQGYVGTNWQVNVMRDAEKLGLLNGFAADYKIEKAITREEAAQMMLNALKAPMVVGTVSDSIVNISNSVWISLVDLKAGTVTITLLDAVNKYNCFVLYGNVLVSNIPVWTNYAGLKVDADARDCYGNPVTKWSYTNAYGKETWSAEYAQAYDYYYTAAATLKTDLDKLGNVRNGIEYYVDGQRDLAVDTLDELYTAVNNVTGNGVEIKVYIQTTITPATNKTAPATIGNKVIVTVKNTYIGQVASLNKGAGTFTLTNGETYKNGSYGFDKDDVILYWLCAGHDNGLLHTAEIATPVNVDLTYVSNAISTSYNSYITGSGKKYEYAENLGNRLGIGSFVSGSLLTNTENRHDDNTFDLYLDKFGYIMGWVEVEPGVEDGYVYLVEGTGKSNIVTTDDNGNITYNSTATTVDFSATMTENDKISRNAYTVMLEAMTGNGTVGTYDYSNCGHGVLVHYTMVDGEKHVTYTDVATQAGRETVLNKNGNLYVNGYLLANGNDETKYLVRTWDYTSGKYVYKAYTNETLDQNYCGDLGLLIEDNDMVKANIQYFTETVAGNTMLTYVFVNALYTNSTPARAFIMEEISWNSGDAFNDVLGSYKAYKAIVDGKEAVLAITEKDGYTVNYGVYEANLTVIGLLDTENGNIPVYADLNARPTLYDDIDLTGWFYDRGKLLLYKQGSPNILPALTPAEDFFAVIATQKDDGTYDVKVTTNPEDVNGYVEEDANGNYVFNLSGGYRGTTSWLVYGDNNETAAELYLKIDKNA